MQSWYTFLNLILQCSKILVEKYGDVKNRMEMIDNKKVKKIISQYGGHKKLCASASAL